MEAPKFTGKDHEKHKRLPHMMMFQILLFSYFNKLWFHGALFWGCPVQYLARNILYLTDDTILFFHLKNENLEFEYSQYKTEY